MLENVAWVYVLYASAAVAISILLFILVRRWLRRRAFPRTGETFERRYQLGYGLGRGMNAVTYRVRDTHNPSDPLAAKFLLTPSDEPRITESAFRRHIVRFRREMEHLRQVQGNPFVVPLHSFHPNGMPPFFVMGLCEGSLADEIRNAPLAMARVLEVLADVCSGLAEIHSHGIIHRDLKPANILHHSEHWVLADFGMSLLGGEGSVVTVPDSLPGTIPYTAPEVMYCAPESITEAADVFSLGITLKEILTGTHAWEGRTSSYLRTRVRPGVRVAIELFDDLIEEMTRLTPTRRPRTIAAVAQRLVGAFESMIESEALVDLLEPLDNSKLKIAQLRRIR